MNDHPEKYSNRPNRIEAMRAWRDAAIADGWTAEPTYEYVAYRKRGEAAARRAAGDGVHARPGASGNARPARKGVRPL